MAPGDIPTQVILETYNKMPNVSPKKATVLVTVFNADLYSKSLEISSLLRSNNIDTELWLEPDAKLDKQLKYADQKGIPYVIIIGPDEAKNDQATLKNLGNKTQKTLKVSEIIATIKGC